MSFDVCAHTHSCGLVCVFVICVPHFYLVCVPALRKHVVGHMLKGLYIKREGALAILTPLSVSVSPGQQYQLLCLAPRIEKGGVTWCP